MRIVVLSDTHIPHRASDLPTPVWDAIDAADLVIHAGDFTSHDFLVELRSVKPLKAVYGNMDEYAIVSTLPEREVFEVEGKRIGIIHGFGAPLGLEQRVKARFKDTPLDILIFGHSHQALIRKEEGGLLLLNPGSPTDTIFARKRTFILLTLEGERVDAELVTL